LILKVIGPFLRGASAAYLALMIVPLVAFLITYFMKPTYVSTVTILVGDTRVLPTTVQQDIEGHVGGGYDYRNTQDIQNSISIR